MANDLRYKAIRRCKLYKSHFIIGYRISKYHVLLTTVIFGSGARVSASAGFSDLTKLWRFFAEVQLIAS